MSGEDVDYEEEGMERESEVVNDSPKKTSDVKIKGRGHNRRSDADDTRYEGRGGVFERIEQTAGPGPLQC